MVVVDWAHSEDILKELYSSSLRAQKIEDEQSETSEKTEEEVLLYANDQRNAT